MCIRDRDKSSSESLIGASIYDAKSHQGTTSNADGFFSLTLEAGNDVYMKISYVGYDSFHRSFTQLEPVSYTHLDVYKRQ